MMRKWFLLFLFFITVFIGACESPEPEPDIDQSDLETALEALEPLPDELDQDIVLPESAQDFGLDWASEKPAYLSENGEVTRPAYDSGDVEVALTATITHDELSASRTFHLIVLALPEIESVAAGISLPEETKADITLPTFLDGYYVDWDADAPEYLNHRGQVKRPAYATGDQPVVLTATLRDQDGRNTFTREFIVLVEAYSESETIEKMETALEALSLPSTVRDPLDLDAFLRHFNGEWTSSAPDVIDASGMVYRPSSDAGDKTVQLTVELLDGDIERSKTFDITVEAYSEAEETAMAKFEAALDEIAWASDTITEDLELPGQIGDVTLTWRSASPGIIASDGSLRPMLNTRQDLPVEMHVDMTYEDITMTYTIDVYVGLTIDPIIEYQTTVSFLNEASEYRLSATDIELFYTDHGNIPYVDVTDFLRLLDGGMRQGAIDKSLIDITFKDDILLLEVHIDAEDADELIEDDTEIIEATTYWLEINFEANTVTVDRYSFFTSFQESTQTDFGAGLDVVEYDINVLDPVTFDFNEYGMPLFVYEDKQLLPLHIANIFFSGSMFDIYYNGENLYGLDTYQIMSMDDDLRETLLSSDWNEETMSPAFLSYVYDYLAFSFDFFFGLKEDYAVDSFYNVIDEADVSKTGTEHYIALFEFVYGLDDLHSSFGMTGPYAPDYDPTLALNHLGSRTVNFYESYWDLQDAGTCERNTVVYYDEDTIARVPLHGFDEATPDTFKAFLDEIEAKGTVTDVIVDLSCNTGGIIGTMIQVLGYITDEDIAYHSRNAGDGSTVTIWYTSENEAYDFDWHFLISNVTYSAGNAMAQIAKDMELGTIMGTRSQGGASSITTNILPSGAILIMSSSSVLTDSEHNSIEFGVPVDVSLGLHQIELPRIIIDRIRNSD